MTEKALLWDSQDAGRVVCRLCSHRCTIAQGKLGRCSVRKNIDGVLYSLNYDHVCAASADPIEKKPLYHFMPGTSAFSISCPGCNFKCDFCQNWQISQQSAEGNMLGRRYEPGEIVNAAVASGCGSIAYTYTEPTVFMELAADCGRLAKDKGLKNIFVSNGYMTREAVNFAAEWLDAINIDLKAFTENYYQSHCRAKLAPVLETIKHIAKETDIWLEITTLIVPDENDSEDELKQIAEFIARDAGPEVPWHISRFYPQYQMSGGGSTPAQTLEKAYNIGKDAGLKYIYVGNLPSARAQNTLCPDCGSAVIERNGYIIRAKHLRKNLCEKCGAQIHGVEIG